MGNIAIALTRCKRSVFWKRKRNAGLKEKNYSLEGPKNVKTSQEGNKPKIRKGTRV